MNGAKNLKQIHIYEGVEVLLAKIGEPARIQIPKEQVYIKEDVSGQDKVLLQTSKVMDIQVRGRNVIIETLNSIYSLHL